jgi:hypothetical protein
MPTAFGWIFYRHFYQKGHAYGIWFIENTSKKPFEVKFQ